MATKADTKAQLQEQIKAQGDVVRRLKKDKKPGEEVIEESYK